MGKLKIEIRHQQVFDIFGNPIYYAGPNPNNLTKIIGAVSSNVWIDVTKYVTNLDKFSITWTLNRNANGESTPGANQPKKAASNSITFNGQAFDYIKEWLWNDVASPLNIIEVQVTDTTCGVYSGFSIKNTDTSYCTKNACSFEVTLQQKDYMWACIQKTTISDNWQGWFQNQPKNLDGSNKYHPRFSYCVEERPNGKLVVIFYLLTIFYPLMLAIGILITFLSLLILPISIIISFIGTLGSGSISIPPVPNPFTQFTDIIARYQEAYVESAGCGREQPAPLNRDYILNVCAKCGIEVNAESFPLFFAPTIDFDTSSRGLLKNQVNEYYNACYFYPQSSRGVRRIDDSTTFYLPENAPIIALSDFLDQQAALYNHEWRIATDPISGKSTLYFQRKDWYRTSAPLYDFSKGGSDESKLLYGVCYQWDTAPMYAYTNGVYTTDALDSCGNEVAGANGSGQMNGIATFGQTDNNPNFQGNLDKTTKFGGTKFRFDGASTDYIYDAIQFCSTFNIAITTTPILKSVCGLLAQYANYALLLKDEVISAPKTIIWDGVSFLNAHALGVNGGKVPIINSLSTGLDSVPNSNIKYPDSLPTLPVTFNSPLWSEAHTVYNKTLYNIYGSIDGQYQIVDLLHNLIDHAECRLVNYPMYFDPRFQDTMWDRFHWIDDPRYNPSMRLTWTLQIDLCCPDLNKCGLIGDGTGAKVAYPVKLDLPYYPDGIITEITADYDSGTNLGMHIELKGKA